MKILLLLFAALLVAGCGEKSSDSVTLPLSDADVVRLLKEAVDADSLEERGDLRCQVNESEPYSGWAKKMHDSGQVMVLFQFKDGKFDGPYTAWHENGKKSVEATFKDGEPVGLMTQWHENGQKKEEETYKDGKEAVDLDSLEERDGRFYQANESEPFSGWAKEMWDSEQVSFLRNYKDGKQDGLETAWDPHGRKMAESTYKDGKKDGLETGWHENGQKAGEVTCKDGKLDGLFTGWHENGKKATEETWKDGEQDGPQTYWHENGQKSREGDWDNGKLLVTTVWMPNGEKCPNTKFENGNGIVYDYWDNGQKEHEATYKDGKEDGPQTYWYENGQKELEAIYKDGEEVSAKYWNSKGEEE